jgi:hypothetical protein
MVYFLRDFLLYAPRPLCQLVPYKHTRFYLWPWTAAATFEEWGGSKPSSSAFMQWEAKVKTVDLITLTNLVGKNRLRTSAAPEFHLGQKETWLAAFLTIKGKVVPRMGEWSASRPGRFTPGERAPGTHWIEGWVGPRASLDDVEKRKFLALPGLELRPLGRPARSQSQHRLCCPGSSFSSQYGS